jgi:predicted signal transduction protein with EAL and GGDEF domain
MTAVSGVATFSGLSAHDDGLVSATSNSIVITPAAASRLVIVQQPNNATAGQSIGTLIVNVEDVVVPEDLAEQESILRNTIERRGRSEREFRIRRGDGSLRVIHSAEAVVLDKHQRPPRVVGVNQDVTEARQAEARIRHISPHDALTGLPNRLLFADRVDQALLRLKRDPIGNFAVIFIDLDRFKVINDGMGHATGDAVLKTIAARLLACVRTTDSLSRPSSVQTADDVPGLGHSTVLLPD